MMLDVPSASGSMALGERLATGLRPCRRDSVPEPGTGLLAMGAALFMLRQR
jgi:hypothetical protein